MYVIMTRVKLREGTSEQCAELFERSNPGLVSNEQDWLGARMIFDSHTNVVTVLASWRNPSSYKAMSAKPSFQNTMKEFSSFFASAPEITVNDVLVDMVPQSN